MPTNRTRRSRAMRPELSQEQIDYFLTGIDFAFFWDEPEREIDWQAAREEILADFIAEHPGRRPFFWWIADAPGPRLRVGGKGDLVPAYDHPDNWKFGIFRKGCFMDEELLRNIDTHGRVFQVYNPAAPPVFESEAAYLRRHKLFLPGEEKRLTDADFEAEEVR